MKKSIITCATVFCLSWAGYFALAGTFTDPLTTHAQDIRLMQQFTNAWNERILAINSGLVLGGVTTNDTFQDIDMPTGHPPASANSAPWTNLQSWLISNCVYFVNLSAPVVTNVDDPGRFLVSNYTSIAQVFENAAVARTNITWRNFRRAQVWNPPAAPVWTNEGVAQVGDIAQVWVWQDIQTVFSQLTTTKRVVEADTGNTNTFVAGSLSNKYAQGYDLTELEFSVSNACVIWYTNNWVIGSVYATDYLNIDMTKYANPPPSSPQWRSSQRIDKKRPRIAPVCTFIPVTCDRYLWVDDIYESANTKWEDVYSNGTTQAKWFYWGSQDSISNSAIDAATYPPYNDLVCPYDSSTNRFRTEGLWDYNVNYALSFVGWILKWDFTYDTVP
jgi:hypothetical protein